MANPNRVVCPRHFGLAAIKFVVLVTVSLLTLLQSFGMMMAAQPENLDRFVPFPVVCAPGEVEEKSEGAVNSPSDYSSSLSLDHDIRRADDDGSNKREVPSNDKRKIPSNKVFVTGPWVPETIIAENLKTNPHLEFHFYNNSAMARSVMYIDRQLQAEANVTGAWEAWKALRPWAFRVDLWRYMILWSEGGIYMDSKIKFTAPVHVWAGFSQDETLSVCGDNNLKFKSASLGREVDFLWNAMMSARKRSPVMLEAIRLVIRNVEERRYLIAGEEAGLIASGAPFLSVTGPQLLGYVAARLDHANYQKNISENNVRLDCMFSRPSLLHMGNMSIAELDTEERSKVKNNGNRYLDLFKRQMIYCDEIRPDMREGENLPCKLEEFLPELAEDALDSNKV